MGVSIIGLEESTCTIKALITLEEKGVTDFELKPVNVYIGAHKTEEYLAKQPFGVIPVLEDGDLTLFESRAISRYIAEKYRHQGTPLLPDENDVKAKALFEQWAVVEEYNYDRPATGYLKEKFFKPLRGIPTEPAVLENYRSELIKMLDVFEKILSKQKYMGGDEFSLIDIFYIPATQTIIDIGDGNLFTERKNVNAWWERVSTRDSWKKLGPKYLKPPSKN